MVGRTSKTREATQTVGLHGQHLAVDKITISQCVRAAEDRSRWKEISQSSDGGQQSNMICRNEEDTAYTFFHPLGPTSLFGSAFLSHDKHVPCGAVQPTTNSRCRKKICYARGPLGRGPRARATSAPWLIRHRTHTHV